MSVLSLQNEIKSRSEGRRDLVPKSQKIAANLLLYHGFDNQFLTTDGAFRWSLDDRELPGIPAHPIGYGDAEQILK